jgi:hypothetical protein
MVTSANDLLLMSAPRIRILPGGKLRWPMQFHCERSSLSLFLCDLFFFHSPITILFALYRTDQLSSQRNKSNREGDRGRDRGHINNGGGRAKSMPPPMNRNDNNDARRDDGYSRHESNSRGGRESRWQDSQQRNNHRRY